ncbi:MFS transporter [Paraburkholderia sp. ZP32-5]|uniref:MFS transporter n=1 Tax=Paraburkholderia sp. ZP32-5 TaxID=2883245 RepID=UPI001F3320CA|nr:MFS transporter [Paraburkholderia sp. ZP32-5]
METLQISEHSRNDAWSRRDAWKIVILLFIFQVINYAAKTVFGLSGNQMVSELQLTNTQFGELGSAFYFLFPFAGMLAGILSIRFSTKMIMFWMCALWALSLIPMMGHVTFTGLLLSRMLLGAAEGPAFAIQIHAVHKWFPDRARAIPTSVVISGASIGTGIIAPVLVPIIRDYNWHAAYGFVGAVAVIWCVIWLFVGKEGTVNEHSGQESSSASVSFAKLLFNPTAIGFYIGGFASYTLISLNTVWVARYLTKSLGYSAGQTANIFVIASIVWMISLPGTAYISQRLSERGVSGRIARGGVACASLLISGLAILGMSSTSAGILNIIMIAPAFTLGTSFLTLGPLMVGQFCPERQRGAVFAIMNAILTTAGMITPVLFGKIVDSYSTIVEGSHSGFHWEGLFVVGCAIVAFFLINPDRERSKILGKR